MIAVEQLQARERRRAILRILLLATALMALYALLPLQNEKWWLGLVIGLVAVAAIVPVTVRRIDRDQFIVAAACSLPPKRS